MLTSTNCFKLTLKSHLTLTQFKISFIKIYDLRNPIFNASLFIIHRHYYLNHPTLKEGGDS